MPATLEFLEKTRVGKMPGRILLAGGPDLEEEEIETFSLQVLGEEGGRSEVSSSEEEEGLSPPSSLYFSFVFLYFLLFGSLLWVRSNMGRRRTWNALL